MTIAANDKEFLHELISLIFFAQNVSTDIMIINVITYSYS